ncbi:unnamed protein product [[Candida] boidinii]|nr:unnamed protein product [[Candida] boidinii]
MVTLKKSPPDGHRLIVISTTSSYSLLKQLDMLGCFNDEIAVPCLRHLDELERVMADTNFGDQNTITYVSESIKSTLKSDEINVPIKKTLFNIDTAKFGANSAEDLIQLMLESTHST